jgi:hypothetical protein
MGQKQTSIPNQDSYRDLTGAGGTACVPVALAEAESGTTGMSASPFARLLKQASRVKNCSTVWNFTVGYTEGFGI